MVGPSFLRPAERFHRCDRVAPPVELHDGRSEVSTDTDAIAGNRIDLETPVALFGACHGHRPTPGTGMTTE
jgi:hypothetical protein